MDSKSLEKRLISVKESSEDIQTLSRWCIQHRSHHHSIVQAWSRAIRKAKVGHRLTLFYVCNDIVQNAKRKKCPELVQFFGTAVKEAAPLVREDKIRRKILRIFNIWEERGIYDSKLVSELVSIVENIGTVNSTENDIVLSTFQLEQLVESVRNLVALERTSESLLADLKTQEHLLTEEEIKELRLTVKERGGSREKLEEFEDSVSSLEYYINSLQNEIDERTKAVTLLEQAEIFYETQRGEAKLVSTAYKNFYNQVKYLKKKLLEKVPKLPDEISPVPSPPLDAPSPQSDTNGVVEVPLAAVQRNSTERDHHKSTERDHRKSTERDHRKSTDRDHRKSTERDHRKSTERDHRNSTERDGTLDDAVNSFMDSDAGSSLVQIAKESLYSDSFSSDYESQQFTTSADRKDSSKSPSLPRSSSKERTLEEEQQEFEMQIATFAKPAQSYMDAKPMNAQELLDTFGSKSVIGSSTAAASTVTSHVTSASSFQIASPVPVIPPPLPPDPPIMTSSIPSYPPPPPPAAPSHHHHHSHHSALPIPLPPSVPPPALPPPPDAFPPPPPLPPQPVPIMMQFEPQTPPLPRPPSAIVTPYGVVPSIAASGVWMPLPPPPPPPPPMTSNVKDALLPLPTPLTLESVWGPNRSLARGYSAAAPDHIWSGGYDDEHDEEEPLDDDCCVDDDINWGEPPGTEELRTFDRLKAAADQGKSSFLIPPPPPPPPPQFSVRNEERDTEAAGHHRHSNLVDISAINSHRDNRRRTSPTSDDYRHHDHDDDDYSYRAEPESFPDRGLFSCGDTDMRVQPRPPPNGGSRRHVDDGSGSDMDISEGEGSGDGHGGGSSRPHHRGHRRDRKDRRSSSQSDERSPHKPVSFSLAAGSKPLVSLAVVGGKSGGFAPDDDDGYGKRTLPMPPSYAKRQKMLEKTATAATGGDSSAASPAAATAFAAKSLLPDGIDTEMIAKVLDNLRPKPQPVDSPPKSESVNRALVSEALGMYYDSDNDSDDAAEPKPKSPTPIEAPAASSDNATGGSVEPERSTNGDAPSKAVEKVSTPPAAREESPVAAEPSAAVDAKSDPDAFSHVIESFISDTRNSESTKQSYPEMPEIDRSPQRSERDYSADTSSSLVEVTSQSYCSAPPAQPITAMHSSPLHQAPMHQTPMHQTPPPSYPPNSNNQNINSSPGGGPWHAPRGRGGFFDFRGAPSRPRARGFPARPPPPGPYHRGRGGFRGGRGFNSPMPPPRWQNRGGRQPWW